MNELRLYAEWVSVGESSFSTDDSTSDKIDSATRFHRVEDMMRMFSTPQVGSRRFTSVVVNNQEPNLLSYGTYTVEDTQVAKRTSTKMLNFVDAMSIIYGGHENLSPATFIRWRRRLMKWIRLSTLKKRAAKGSQFIYTVDPRATKPENRFQMQKIRERLWNELKAHEFCLNNFIEQEEMCKRLVALNKKQMRRAVKDLAHKEYVRVNNLLNRGLLTPDEVTCLREQYSREPPKIMLWRKTGKPVQRTAPYIYIPTIKTKQPAYHNVSYLEQIMKARLKQLNQETPEVKKAVYRMTQRRSTFKNDALHQLLEEVFGSLSARSSTGTSSVNTGPSEMSQETDIKSSLWNESHSPENSIYETDISDRSPVTTLKIPLGQTTSEVPQWDDELYENESVQYLYDQAELLFPNLRHRSQDASESHT